MADDIGDREPDLPESDVSEVLQPFEPYTTGEVASLLDRPKQLVRRVLNALSDRDEVRKKETKSGPVIWIREPPAHECPDCGHGFEVKFLHPVFSAARYCPRCGTRLP